ncbi:hypothetical protein N3K66_008229 [Trichothecium roseum]|uniref:Uncharacterized protein n=1 Tax=Trichothecium roseum TaxID=47278 RepID=A0ACC0UUM1_9HYPO|nr:hypothetical protein N3K66_008229 [Trichothecium roseum]
MADYAADHANPQGAGDKRPTALQIIHDESLVGELAGKIMVVTGAASGIGLETARALSATGASLILPVRDIRKAEANLAPVLSSGRASLVPMDLSSFASVRRAAAVILEKSDGVVNVLVCNAGVMGIRELSLTADGHEMHFGTNYLGHFLLFHLLKHALLAGSTPQLKSRVVVLTSSVHRTCRLGGSDDYSFQKGGYSQEVAYARSKLTNIYMANELDRRYGHKGLRATSVHPGGIITEISRHMDSQFVPTLMKSEHVVKTLKSAEQGAATTVLAAVGKAWEDRGGRYLEDCGEAERGEDDNLGFGPGYVEQTYDPSDEARLWEDSLEIVGVDRDD